MATTEQTSELVSVIIPAYNQAGYLGGAIDCCLRQSYPAIEVIVVNDGSTDDTASLLGRYARHENVIAIHQANGGLPAARNAGIAVAKGAYLCFLDSDDLLLPDKVSKQVAVLAGNPQFDLVYCDIETIDEQGEVIDDGYSVGAARPDAQADIFDALVIGGYFPPHTILVRKASIDALGPFDVDLGGHADYELWLRLAASGRRAYYIDERLVQYRRHAGQMSQDNEHMTRTRVATLEKIARVYPQRLAASISGLQTCNEELNKANDWLAARWDGVLEQAARGLPALRSDAVSYSLMSHLDQAKLLEGAPEQLAIWDATIDGIPSRALFLGAPAQVVFTVPRGDRGRLNGAVALHPDVWDNAACGGCTFIAVVDQKLAMRLTIDPTHNPADRTWLAFELPVPAAEDGQHEVLLATEGVRGNDHRWALWRDPHFAWDAGEEQGG